MKNGKTMKNDEETRKAQTKTHVKNTKTRKPWKNTGKNQKTRKND